MEGVLKSVLKSFCIKTNNKNILNYLLNSFKHDSPNNFYISKNHFKIYNNIIYHYNGIYEELYYDYISDYLKKIILKFYEKDIILRIINYNYFYFSDVEKKDVLNLCLEQLTEDNTENTERKKIIFYLCKDYVKEHKTVILDGLVNFRLKEYISILDSIVETCISSYIVEQEYLEFINLLKIYINSQDSSNSILHLIYFNHESLLLDNNKNVLKIDNNISNAKYLSDITFSSNDYCLNTLLNILPQRIYIHLLDKEEDEFIITLKSIFEKRAIICYNCNMCKNYNQLTLKSF